MKKELQTANYRLPIKETNFLSIFNQYNWKSVTEAIYSKTSKDVVHALNTAKPDLNDFMALLSPAAENHLEEMAQLSHRKTLKRFGKTMQLFAPMYLSNECQNICTYCGFSLDNPIPRKTLTDEEILAEVRVLKEMGYDHILIVTGEADKTVGMDYFKNALTLIRPYFSHISMEVQVYQETYHRDEYKKHHPKGKKSNFNYRLDTPDRLGKAGVFKIGLGALIGLEDWRTDSFFTALHLDYLEKTYWQSKYSISFPRLRPCAGMMELKSVMLCLSNFQ